MRISVISMVTVVALLWHHKSNGYFELTEEYGCHNTEFRLSCGSINANIVIFEASFSQNDSFLKSLNFSCDNSEGPPNKNEWSLKELEQWENTLDYKFNTTGISELNFRHAINRRCSGVKYCSFVLREDFEEGRTLGPGVVYLKYACVTDDHVTRGCHSDIDATHEGFVSSPGYPRFYPGESSCFWTLVASPPQRVRVTFLDVSLRGLAPFEGECLDWVDVYEDGLNLLSACGDVLEDTSVLSDGPSLNVSFKTSSKTLFPKRGFLFHYKAVGCGALKKPEDGYLISRNGTFAHYRCLAGFAFPDSKARDRILSCFNENTWDTHLPDCVNVSTFISENSTGGGNFTAEARSIMEISDDTLKDIIFPLLVLSILFVGNTIILWIINQQRKKQETDEVESTELHQIP